MNVIAIANPAGGGGQTTTVVSLADALVSEGFVLVVYEITGFYEEPAFMRSSQNTRI